MAGKLSVGKIREIVSHYLMEGQTLKSTAQHFRTQVRVVTNIIQDVAVYDEELFQKAAEKMLLNDRESNYKREITDSSFKSLRKRMTALELSDWYINEGFNQELAVKELIARAERNGIVVIR